MKVIKMDKHSQQTSKLERVDQPTVPHYLTEEGLVLHGSCNEDDGLKDCVPPPTPNADYEFSNNFYQFPRVLPDISELNLPYVREIGVKASIDVLGDYFQCRDYKFNMLQFWFLDIITASLWATQDDFQFPDYLQKVVLAWILYFINLIRDRSKNITRKQFIGTFKEAILTASEVVEEGCEIVPTPDKLIILLEDEDKEPVSWKSSSTDESSSSSLEINQEDLESTNLIELGADDENRHKYVLPEAKWRYQNHELSSAASSSTSGESEEYENTTKKNMKRRLKDVEFYKPDLNIPARFVVLNEEYAETLSEEEESESCICKMEKEVNVEEEKVQDEISYIHEVTEKFQMESSAESVDTLTETEDLVSPLLSSTTSEEINRHSILESTQKPKDTKDIVLKNLAIQKIQEQHIADMANPKKGYIPSDTQIIADEAQEASNHGEEEESEESVDNEWIDAVINQQNQRTMDNEDRQIMNYAVLRAIMDIIIKYFYESFQFTLIKMAFQATPEVICQKVNKEWKMPKKNMLGFVRPKEQKPPKAPKVKKEKADKKKGKPSKEKSSKGKKDKKKEKPKKLTKEEKAELARRQKEQEKLEEEMRKIEENKRFMFPLADAATDDLFMKIFENWVKVDLTKKAQKGKGKGKK